MGASESQWESSSPLCGRGANFGKILGSKWTAKGHSLVIEKRGTPRAVLMSLREYVKLAAPEPEILRIIGEDAKRREPTS